MGASLYRVAISMPQAGDKVKALKALIRAGDVEKIVFFAGAADLGSLTCCSVSAG
jgi:hypothetical protein